MITWIPVTVPGFFKQNSALDTWYQSSLIIKSAQSNDRICHSSLGPGDLVRSDQEDYRLEVVSK
jgi:hypothetical protein